MVYKFPELSPEEIHQMLKIASSAQETRYYQEAREAGLQEGRQEGRQEGERSLILRQLQRRFGPLPETARSRIDSLTLQQLDSLGDALLDFQSLADLATWLQAMG